MRAADAPAQLVELSEAEAIRTIDDNRVRRRHVDAAFDNGRAQQHVEAPMVEVEHDLLEFAFGHLAVADADVGLRNQLLQPLLYSANVLDAVVNKIHLSTALDFTQAGLANDDFIPLGDKGLDGEAFRRRCGDQRHFAQAAERHVERPRNRRRGQRQDVDFAAQRLDRLLVTNAEAMLLIDDDEPDVA